MAVDRGNTRLADRFDPLCAPFLRALKTIADAGRRNRTPVTLCGELAGKPISAMALAGIGFRSISMSPASIGPVKAMLRELPLKELEAFFADNLDAPAAKVPMRALLQAFADDRGIPV
jgi:phosphotransferase system enzyme I (PtsP)